MRRYISIIENAVENPFNQYKGQLERFLLPAGTTLYHGTDRPQSSWDPSKEKIWSPVWFGLTREVARDYAKFNRSSEKGSPMIYEYRTNVDLLLLEASNSPVSELMDRLYDEYMTDEIAHLVLEMGYDGWHIVNSEVMIGYTDLLTFVRADAVM